MEDERRGLRWSHLETWPYKSMAWAILLLEDCKRSDEAGDHCPGCTLAYMEYYFQKARGIRAKLDNVCNFCIFQTHSGHGCKTIGSRLYKQLQELEGEQNEQNRK